MEHAINYFDPRVRDEIWSWPGDTLADYARVVDAVMRFGVAPWIPRLRRARWGVVQASLTGAGAWARAFLCAPEPGHVLILLACSTEAGPGAGDAEMERTASRRMRTLTLLRSGYRPVAHDHATFLRVARGTSGFDHAYESLADEYLMARECVRRRGETGLTQTEVALQMGTTDSAVSRLEHARGLSPSLVTVRKYAHALGCDLEVRLVPGSDWHRGHG